MTRAHPLVVLDCIDQHRPEDVRDDDDDDDDEEEDDDDHHDADAHTDDGDNSHSNDSDDGDMAIFWLDLGSTLAN